MWIVAVDLSKSLDALLYPHKSCKVLRYHIPSLIQFWFLQLAQVEFDRFCFCCQKCRFQELQDYPCKCKIWISTCVLKLKQLLFSYVHVFRLHFFFGLYFFIQKYYFCNFVVLFATFPDRVTHYGNSNLSFGTYSKLDMKLKTG